MNFLDIIMFLNTINFILLQSQHYKTLMPEVFRKLQEVDEKRIRCVRDFMIHSADVERNVFPIINKCLDGIINAAHEVNEKQVNYQLCTTYLVLTMAK